LQAFKNQVDYEKIIKTKQDNYLKIKYNAVFIDNILFRHVWQIEDITIKIKAEKDIQLEREFYLQILDNLPADIVVFNEDCKFQFINAFAIKDKTFRDWLIGKEESDYYTHRKINDFAKAEFRKVKFDEMLEDGKRKAWIEEFPLKDGSVKIMNRTLEPIYNDNCEFKMFISCGFEITAQREVENKLVSLNIRVKDILTELNDAVFQIDFEGRVFFHNKSCNDLFPFFKLSNDNVFSFQNCDANFTKSELALFIKPYLFVKKYKKSIKGVFKYVDPISNSIRHFDYYYWLTNSDIFEESITARITEITSHVTKLNDMQLLVQKEQELNTMKSDFIHITSHEIRTPLSIILSSAEIIQMTIPPNLELVVDPLKYMKNIISEVDHVTNLLNQLLIVGEIEKGKSKFKPDWYTVEFIIDKVVSNRFRPYSDDRSLLVKTEISEKSVYLDIKLIKHALENLISNAFKYSLGKTAPTLSVYIENKNIVFAVYDNGIGIPKDEMGQLFQSFFRASNTGNIAGTGIGLIVVEHASLMHNGFLEVKSELGKYTEFRLIIPQL
jgi:signal transduction histidine kinase